MLIYNGAEILDRKFINLIDFLQEGDVLVFNDVRVIKAKMSAQVIGNNVNKAIENDVKNGHKNIENNDENIVKKNIEFNLDQEISKNTWRVILRGAKKIKDGDLLKIAPDFFARITKKLEDGFALLEFAEDDYREKLDKYGVVPLPPYIKRAVEDKNIAEKDQKNYQTIYAKEGAAVAAPTAGLHFTDKIFSLLDAKKIKKVFVTLNVGAGTFLPVRSERLQDHNMHEESFSISKESAEIINETKRRGGRVVAVGTTSLRVLESIADDEGNLREAKTKTKIFIYPPYKFKVVDILVTNFHLPKSTLFMLVCAFVGKEKAKEIYDHAISQNYRFYSYGDASLLMKPSAMLR